MALSSKMPTKYVNTLLLLGIVFLSAFRLQAMEREEKGKGELVEEQDITLLSQENGGDIGTTRKNAKKQRRVVDQPTVGKMEKEAPAQKEYEESALPALKNEPLKRLHGAIGFRVDNLKNTYQVIDDNYKQLSLIHGAIGWETGFVRRVYELGDDESYQGSECPAIIRLARLLFSHAPGSHQAGDFRVTDLLNRQDSSEEMLTRIARILYYCTQARKALQNCSLDFKNHILKLATREQRKKFLQTNTVLSEQIQKIAIFWQCVNECMKDIVFLVSVKEGDIFARDELDTARMYLARALQEEHKLLPHMLEMLFLTLVYKQYGHDKGLIRYFYERLNQYFDGAFFILPRARQVFQRWSSQVYERLMLTLQSVAKFKMVNRRLHQLPHNWEHDYYDQVVTPLEAKVHLKKCLEMPSGWRTSAKKDYTLCFEDVVFYSLQLAYQPKTNTCQLLKNAMKKGLVTDDIPNAVRNFVGALCYDAQTQTYNEQVLQKYITEEGQKIFSLYYSKPLSSVADDTLQDHQYWFDALKSFNTQSSIKDIIMLITTLFGFDISFKQNKNALDLSRDENDFIKDIFPQLCEKLNCSGWFIDEHTGATISLDAIDQATLNPEAHITMHLKFDDKEIVHTGVGLWGRTYEKQRTIKPGFECVFDTKFGTFSLRGVKTEYPAYNERGFDFDKTRSLSLMISSLRFGEGTQRERKQLDFPHLYNNEPEMAYSNYLVLPQRILACFNQKWLAFFAGDGNDQQADLNDLRVAYLGQIASNSRLITQDPCCLKVYASLVEDGTLKTVAVSSDSKLAMLPPRIALTMWDTYPQLRQKILDFYRFEMIRNNKLASSASSLQVPMNLFTQDIYDLSCLAVKMYVYFTEQGRFTELSVNDVPLSQLNQLFIAEDNRLRADIIKLYAFGIQSSTDDMKRDMSEGFHALNEVAQGQTVYEAIKALLKSSDSSLPKIQYTLKAMLTEFKVAQPRVLIKEEQDAQKMQKRVSNLEQQVQKLQEVPIVVIKTKKVKDKSERRTYSEQELHQNDSLTEENKSLGENESGSAEEFGPSGKKIYRQPMLEQLFEEESEDFDSDDDPEFTEQILPEEDPTQGSKKRDLFSNQPSSQENKD